MDVMQELDSLLEKLSGASSASTDRATTEGQTRDAIDQVIDTPARVTSTRRLREDPVMLRFRDEMAQGVVHADTVRGVLALLSRILDNVLLSRG